jgi:hypothetical protein
MGIKVQVRRRLAVGIAGVLLASSLVAGIAPVAADDGGAGVQGDAPSHERLEGGDRVITDTHFSITSVMIAPAVSFDAVPPLGDETRYITEGAIDRG